MFVTGEYPHRCWFPPCTLNQAGSEGMQIPPASCSAQALLLVVGKLLIFLPQAIAKAFSDRHPHYKDLQAGVDAAKRIADKVNEAQRREENFKKVQILEKRVKDWKGHHLSNFGNLLLDDIFTVTKSEVDREYHVFLFEKIILCCKEAISTPPGSKKAKNNSLLKKQTTSSPVPATNKEKDTTLLLKGRIFLNNVTQAVPTSPRNSVGASSFSDPFYHLFILCRVEHNNAIFPCCLVEG